MPIIPAFCENCKLIFPSPFEVKNSTNIGFQNIGISCPRCGYRATIPDGVYDVIGNTIEIVKGSSLSKQKIKEYKSLIEHLKSEKADYENVKNEIQKNAPELSSLVGFLPKTKNELYTFLALIIAALSLINQYGDDEKSVNVTNVINHYNTYNVKNETNTIIKSEPKNKKIGRNDKCHCGSGLKYKKCHGKNY